MSKIDDLFETIPAGYFAILTGIAGSITILVSSILYYLAEPFTLTSHWISHLGAGPNGSDVVFTVGLILTGALAFPFLIYLYRSFRPNMEGHKFMLMSAFIASMVAITGLWINAIWNMDYEGGTLHVTGSTTFFFAGLVMIILYSLSILVNSEVSWKHALTGFVIAGIFAFFLISFLPVMAQGYDLMVLLTSTHPVAGTTRFLEWIVFLAVIFWFIYMGIFALKQVSKEK